MVFDEYDVTFSGITNALGFESAIGEIRVFGDYEAYKAEVLAQRQTRRGRQNPFTIVRLSMPSPASAELHVVTRGSEEDFDTPALPEQTVTNPAFGKKLAFHAADARTVALIPPEILNKLSVDSERLHLAVRGNVALYEIVGENTDANYWINVIEFLGKIADRVRKG